MSKGKNVVRNFVLTRDQDDKIFSIAKIMGLSVSALIRKMIDELVPAENLPGLPVFQGVTPREIPEETFYIQTAPSSVCQRDPNVPLEPLLYGTDPDEDSFTEAQDTGLEL